MKFAHSALKEAKGLHLARDVSLKDTTLMPRGTVLGPSEIASLTMAGLRDVYVAEFDRHDIDANTAVHRVVQALVPYPADAHLSIGPVENGRVDVIAQAAGVVGIDTAGVTRMNAADEGITIATLPQFHRVVAGQRVAQIRILPLAVKRSALSRALEDADDMIRLRPVLADTVSLIQTVRGGIPPDGAGVLALQPKLDALGIRVAENLVVPHREDTIAEALLSVHGDLVLILPAEATMDRHDILPQAIQHAGGVITRLGIPVDPGATMLAGGLGAVPILGLPAASRHAGLRGVDWVLERLVCGVVISDTDLAELGVGGLLPD